LFADITFSSCTVIQNSFSVYDTFDINMSRSFSYSDVSPACNDISLLYFLRSIRITPVFFLSRSVYECLLLFHTTHFIILLVHLVPVCVIYIEIVHVHANKAYRCSRGI